MQQIQSSFRVDLKKEKSTFFISSQTISVTIVASWNRCEGKGGIESITTSCPTNGSHKPGNAHLNSEGGSISMDDLHVLTG